MTAIAQATEPGEAPLGRSERLSRDVLHALMIDSQPWKEIQANRREVVRTTFRELDADDEFEGMLAAQMAIAHSIFLGASWLSLDRERPDRDRAFYLRQATRLMTLYRQHFGALRQCRRERQRYNYGPRRLTARGARGHSAPDQVTSGAECPPASETAEKEERGHSAPDQVTSGAECPRCAARDSARSQMPSQASAIPVGEFPPLDFSIPQKRKHRLLATAGLAFAQGP